MVDDTGGLLIPGRWRILCLGVEGWRRSNCWRIWGLPSLQLAGKKKKKLRCVPLCINSCPN